MKIFQISSHLVNILSSNVEDLHSDEQEKANERAVDITSKLQQMWALTETAAENEFTDEQSNFDIDGCYDLNLLSYT